MIAHKFKMTEIGPIPEEWELRRIETNFDFVGNNTFARESMSSVGKVVNIHYGDVLIKYGAYIDVSSDSVMFLDSSIRTTANHALQSGDIVMADTAEDETAGKCCEIIGAKNMQVEAGLHTFVLRPKEKYAPKFLGYAFNAGSYHNQLIPLMQGTKVTSISKGAVGSTFLICPPFDEQERIAKVLSDIDNLISSLESLIAKKLDIKQGAMQQLLTGKKRLVGFNSKWQISQIRDLGELIKNSINPQLYPQKTFWEYSMPAFDNGKIPMASKGSSMNSNRTAIEGDVLLFNKLNVRQKRIWHVNCPKNSLCSTEFLAFISSRINLNLLQYILETDKVTTEFIGMSKGSSNSQKRISPADFLDFKITYPSEQEEQNAISDILSTMDSEIGSLEAKRDKYLLIKQGMMQELLTGRIRLV